MKKILSIGLIIVGFAIFNSCKKDASSEQYTPTPNKPTIPDLTSTITTSVSGFITDERDSAVAGAQVTGGTQTVTTNRFGYFKISDASLSKTAAFIKVTMNGYFNGYRTFVAQQGKETFIRLQLIPKTAIGTINAVTGGTVSTADGATVTLPPNAVIVASNSNAYTGTIHVAAHWINPLGSDLQQTMPGNLLGIDTAGYLKVLATFGMLAVELTDDAGNLLQIANGKQATLSFPIPSGLAASAPATIPLWSFTETNGLWKQESEAKKTGSDYVGNVSHFSYWNCDYALPRVNFKVQIVDSGLHPLANVAVALTITEPYYSTRVAYTDTDGFVYGTIPANNNLELSILSSCNSPLYTKNFTTNDNDVDLGTISANSLTFERQEFIIEGVLTDCNNNPVANGIVMIPGVEGNANNYAYITNGKFSTTILTCGSVQGYSILAIDSTSGQQSPLQSINLAPGVNNLDTIPICSLSQNQYITISVDGGSPVSFTTPFTAGSTADYHQKYISNLFDLTAINYTSTDLDTLNIAIEGNPTAGVVDSLNDSPTNPHGITSIVIGSSKYQSPVVYSSSRNVNITEYGAVGEFISGNFSILFTKLNNTIASHTITCSFRVKRTS